MKIFYHFEKSYNLVRTFLAGVFILNHVCKCSTIAELDLSAVTPYAIVENGTLTNSSLAKISNNSNENSTQALTSYLNSIRTSMLLGTEGSTQQSGDVSTTSVEIFPPLLKEPQPPVPPQPTLKSTDDSKSIQKQQQTPVVLTTKSRAKNVTLMTVPGIPREMALSTVMNVLDLVSMYKQDPSFSRGPSSTSTAVTLSYSGNLYKL